MPNYDEFKEKAKSAFDSFAGASVSAYKLAEEKTKILARKTKLRAGIVNDKATIRRLSVELGSVYYKKYKDDENSEFKQLCEEIKCAYERIALKEEEIAELKRGPANRAAKNEPKQDNCDANCECPESKTKEEKSTEE